VRGCGVLSIGGNERKRVAPDFSWAKCKKVMKSGVSKNKREARSSPRNQPQRKELSAGYSKRDLKDKLGLKIGSTKAILEAPEGFAELIGTYEYDTTLDLESYDYLHFFTANTLALEAIFPILAKRLKRGGILWISWPKKSSGTQTDLGENAVRAHGLATGLVDVKICAIDEIWSGLKFTHRRTSRTI
jgi:hypothetical protein